MLVPVISKLVPFILPTTSNSTNGFVFPIPTLPSLWIVITKFEVLYAPSDNAISNLVLEAAAVAIDLPNRKLALIPISYGLFPPTLHKCKTSIGSMIVGTVWLVIVNGASLWLNEETILFIVNVELLVFSETLVPTPNFFPAGIVMPLFAVNKEVVPNVIPPFAVNAPVNVLVPVISKLVPFILPTTSNSTNGFVFPIPTLPSLWIVITIFEVL